MNVELEENIEHTKRSSLSHHVSLKSTMKLGDSQESKAPEIKLLSPEPQECIKMPVISINAESEFIVSENVDSCKNMPQSKDFNTLGYELVAPKRKATDRVKLDIM